MIKPILWKLILPNQGGFLEKRQIWDNIILVQEAIHSNKSRGEKGMEIKIDIANDFDTISDFFV